MHFDDEAVPARKVLTVELNGARSFVLSGSVLKKSLPCQLVLPFVRHEYLCDSSSCVMFAGSPR
jgi:hypothetical protein